MSICEQCGKEHDGSFGSGRFCCRSCSNKWVALHQSPEAKARKIEKGRKNLKHEISKYATFESRSKGAYASAEIRRAARKEWLDSLLRGEVNWDLVGFSRLLEWLIGYGYKEYKCEKCGNSIWNGRPIPLEVHHEDGDNTNNKIGNLKILCPNCHAQTENYGWKGIKSNNMPDNG